eukprot:1679830-Rhodomonas_salina.1
MPTDITGRTSQGPHERLNRCRVCVRRERTRRKEQKELEEPGAGGVCGERKKGACAFWFAAPTAPVNNALPSCTIPPDPMSTIVTTAPGVELDCKNHPHTPPGPHKPPSPQFPAPTCDTKHCHYACCGNTPINTRLKQPETKDQSTAAAATALSTARPTLTWR